MNDSLLKIFTEESVEIIDVLERGLLELEDSDDMELINAVFRAAHTMKGNAGIMGFDDVVDLTHHMEGMLDEMRKGRMKPDAEMVGLLLSSVDALKVMVETRLDGQEMEPPAAIMAAMAQLLGERQEISQAHESEAQPPDPDPVIPEPPEASPAKNYKITMRLERDLFATGNDPLLLLLELGELGELTEVVCHLDQLPEFSQMKADELYLWWEIYLSSAQEQSTIENVFIFVMDDSNITVEELSAPAIEAAPTPPPPAPKPAPVKPPEPVAHAAQKPSPPKAPRPPQAPAAPAARPAPAPQPVRPTQPAPAAPVAAKPAPAAPAQPPKAPEAQAAPKASKPAAISSTIRVDTEKLDKLVNLVGELVIGVARINQLSGDQGNSELGNAVESLDHISRDLQEQVMRVRMIPVEGTFNRFQRVVRDLAAELGKKIRLEMSGIETELDKNVIEQIADPLKHLIRNSADHGLEPPQERLAAGKPETGTIWLRAYQQEGKIIIEVQDDGRGIDHNKVLAKAVERGLVEPGASILPQQAYSFMFQPGFSTAEKVTEVSGRGVGLDVVRQNIEQLRGSVEIHSEVGAGSTFRIKLPLTLAIIDGMTVRIGDEVLTLPLLSIVESIRPSREEVTKADSVGEMVEVRGEYLPLVRLHEVFDFPTERTDPSKALVVIMESVTKRFGVLVDDILGEQQAVIKSLEQNYQEVEGVAGATILGDGRVSLILDVHGLEKMAFA